MRLFEKLQQLHGTNWQQLAQQFSSDHSVEPVRIAHIAALMSRKEQPGEAVPQTTAVNQESQSSGDKKQEATARSQSRDSSGEYEGQVHNSTHDLAAKIDVILSARDADTFTGCIAIHRPLYGSGEIHGELRGAQVKFAVSGLAGTIEFSGQREGEDIKGTYSVLQKVGPTQFGEFEVHRKADTVPADFDPEKCPNDSGVR
jgi:hypothetical protein